MAPTRRTSSSFLPHWPCVPLDIESPFKQGIDALTPEDLDYAAEIGYRVKHLGIARQQRRVLKCVFIRR